MPNEQSRQGRPWTGQPLARLEDSELLTGAAQYLDDIDDGSDVLHAMVLRSPMAHAGIAGLDVSAAAGMAGVRAVYTAADLDAAGLNQLGLDFPPPAGSVGGDWQPAPHPVLASHQVRFVGEAIAFVVAETRASALDAVEAAMAEYEALPVVAGLRDASAGGHTVDERFPDNCVLTFERGSPDETAAAFAAAAKHVSLDLRQNRVHACAMEPRGCIAEFTEERGFVLRVGTQRPFGMRDGLARILGVPPQRMAVKVPKTGGGFGPKNAIYPEYLMCLFAARALGRPVKWISDRQESFLSDNHARDNDFQLEAALDGHGTILAVRARRMVSLGAYTAPRTMVPVENGTTHLTGVYAIPAAFVRTSAHLANAACTSSYRGAGRPEHVYACERFIDVIARRAGEHPVAFRRRHLLSPDATEPTALGSSYTGIDFARMLDGALAEADFDAFPDRRAATERTGWLRGFGVCLFAEDLHGSSQPAPATIAAVDGRLCVLPGTTSTGHGHETAFRQIAADVLGVSPGELGFLQADTDLVPRGLGTAASWSAMLGGSSVLLAARAAVEEARRLVAASVEADPGDVEFEAGAFGVAGTDIVRCWPDVLALKPDFRAEGEFDGTGQSIPVGCHACEVEVDPDTGRIRLARYLVVQDSGALINPMIAEGQIQGGVAQGVGQAWMEEIVYDEESGQLLTASLQDYALPRARDLPEIDCSFRSGAKESSNPLSVKGLGEAGTTGSMAAFVNAAVDALAPLGVEHIDMPLTPHRVWDAIRRAGPG